MGKLIREGVALFFADAGSGAPPLLFIHGLAADHTFFASQFDYFQHKHRVVAIDLRAHGQSDAPQQDYTVVGFADDLAWMCFELGLYRPVFIGYGLGGMIAVECAARWRDLPAALVALDAPLPPTAEIRLPLLYVGTGAPLTDLTRLRTFSPQLMNDRVIGGAHFHQPVVVEQITMMIERFLEVIHGVPA